jgi:HD-GYP domain-containing protein (c-di-GMP phosphodiesterase class II)
LLTGLFSLFYHIKRHSFARPSMSSAYKKVSLIYFVIATLLMVGLVPLVLTGWFLSERSGRELRVVENRYQIQLVQEKARQMEMFAKRYSDLVSNISIALELSQNLAAFSSAQTEQKLGSILKENPSLIALYVKPVNADSLSVFRPEVLSKSQIESISADAESALGNKNLVVTPPIAADHEGSVLAFASPVMSKGASVATVVAIVSLKEFSRNIIGVTPSDEASLWHSGLPIIFVVDQTGTVLFHPDADLVAKQASMVNLKIVRDWQESNRQVQSALVPFTAEYAGEKHEMIGAYSTVSLRPGLNFGVITMQDERTALASVDDMRNKTWLISLTFACFALLVGLFGTRLLTSPLTRLVTAAQKIAAGDFSSRVETRNITEIGTLGETFNVMSDKLEEHIAKLAAAAKENRELFVGTVKALAAAIDGKDKYTRGHSERVARISVAIGRRMNMSPEDLETLRMSALLHDVGKIAIDDSILKKPAALTDAEFEIMKTHPQKGFKIMSQIPAMKDFLPGMYMHHEMVNGKGYPQGLTGDEIPLQAKIVSVADTFDAMTIDRPYQKALLLDDALARITGFVGTRYDAAVVKALVVACRAGEVANGIVRQKATAAENNTPMFASKAKEPTFGPNPENPLELSF